MQNLTHFKLNLTMAILIVLFMSTAKVKANVVGVDPGSPTITIFNEATWASVSSATLTMAGFEVSGAQSVVWNSDNLLYYAIITTSPLARHLATVDPATGVCTLIGTLNSTAYSSMTYNSDLGIMYIMGGSGGGATISERLFSLNLTNAATTFLAGPFPVGSFGEVIAYNYDDDHIYHWSTGGMEKINATTFAATGITQSGATTDEICGAVYKGGGIFTATNLVFNGPTSGFTITSTGVASLVGPTPYRVRGLGYVDPLLPVELTSFVSSVNGNDVVLQWSTSSETNNSGFEIERNSGGTWSKVGFVNGNGTTSNSSEYNFTDRNLNSGYYLYRLKQVDYNGNFEYFDLSTEISVGVPLNFELSQNYPNPFNPSTTINYEIPASQMIRLAVYDMTGKEVMELVNGFKEAGYHSFIVNASSLTSGVYYYTLSSDNFTEVKKMLLVK